MKIIIFNSSLERLHLEAFVEREDVQIVHIQTAITFTGSYLGVVHYVTILYRELSAGGAA